MMTLAEAAALLEVAVDAHPEQVERAYRYQAQRSHPDRMTSASPAELAAAAARFDRFTQARALLREADAERMRPSPAAAPPGQPAASGASAAPGRHPADSSAWTAPTWAADEPYEPALPAGPWLFWVWTGLFGLAAAISYLGGPLPQSTADLWLRVVPLGLSSVAFARTGRPVFLVGVLVFGAATAVLTVLFASFGPLVTLQLLIAPVLGLVALGRPKQLRRRLGPVSPAPPPRPAG